MSISLRQAYYRNVYLKSEHWQNLRIRRLAIDKGRCVLCGKEDSSNDVHHVIYRNLFEANAGDLRTLCRSCHTQVHKVIEKTRKIKTNIARQIWRSTRIKVSRAERHQEWISILNEFKGARQRLIAQRAIRSKREMPWKKNQFVAERRRIRRPLTDIEWMFFCHCSHNRYSI